VLTDKLQEKVMLDVLQLAGLAGPDQTLPPSVRVKTWSEPQRHTVHYYLNYSDNAQTLSYLYGPGPTC